MTAISRKAPSARPAIQQPPPEAVIAVKAQTKTAETAKVTPGAVFDREYQRDPSASFGANHAAAFWANVHAFQQPGGTATPTVADPAHQAAGVAVDSARTLLGKTKDALDVVMHGALALPHALAQTPAAARAWWQSTGNDHITGPAGAPPTGDPTRVTPQALSAAQGLLAKGDVAGAWNALGQAGDGFARLAGAALTEKPAPKTLFAQVTDAHWERITGKGVAGPAYAQASKALLTEYLGYAQKFGSLPSTEDIERMDRGVMEQQGLPVLLATGSYQSKLAQDFGAEYSWGRAMGMPRERTVGDSKVFSDVTFDATAEMVKTATYATKKYGLTKALTVDGAAATVRGSNVEGNALHMSRAVLLKAQGLAKQGRVADAWLELARHGDGYAAGARMIIEQRNSPQHFLAQTVDAHWDRVVGPEKKAQHFMAVGQRHLDNYLALTLGANQGKLPNTEQIERSYRDAVEAAGLPPMLAIDSLMSRGDALLESSWLAKVGIKDFSWGAVVGMPKDRIVYDSKVFLDVPFNPATEILTTAWATLRKHSFNVLGTSAVGSALSAVREVITQGR